MKRIGFVAIVLFVLSCSTHESDQNEAGSEVDSLAVGVNTERILYTRNSDLENIYLGFNSPSAVNKIAQIENEHINNYNTSLSRYYGTAWYESAIQYYTFNDSINDFDLYIKELLEHNLKPDSLHCTLYAVKALEAGMDSSFVELKKYHKQIWKNREFAGWSVGYILTKYFNWKAYLIVSNYSSELKTCKRNFKKDRKYHVWKQPNIPVLEMLDFENDKKRIDSLLSLHEFGWGFSNQGWHTWITRFDTLKECNWGGAPSLKYADFPIDLFHKTKFTDYVDFDTHIIVFPPKKEK